MIRAEKPARGIEIELVRHYRTRETDVWRERRILSAGFLYHEVQSRINEEMASLRFTNIHHWQSQDTVQGCMEVLYKAEEALNEITGMDRFTMQPSARHGSLPVALIELGISITETHNAMTVPDSRTAPTLRR